jgi:hypothetical protein
MIQNMEGLQEDSNLSLFIQEVKAASAWDAPALKQPG